MRKQVAAILALGPNDIEIPCLLFDSEEEAHNYLKSRGGTPMRIDRRPTGKFHPNDLNVELTSFVIVPDPGGNTYFCTKPDDLKEGWVDIGGDKILDFVTDYYGGCGEISAFKVVSVPLGKPFVGWDLD